MSNFFNLYSLITLFISDIRVDIPSIRNLLSVTSYKALGLKPDGVLYARTIGFGSTANDNGSKGLVTSNSRIGRLKKFERATGYTVRPL